MIPDFTVLQAVGKQFLESNGLPEPATCCSSALEKDEIPLALASLGTQWSSDAEL